MDLLIDPKFLIRMCLTIVIIITVMFLFFKKKKTLVGHVKDIRIYPVKSIKHISLQEAYVTKLGVKHDRQFVLVNEYGTLMTLRRFPKLVLIKAKIKDDCIEVNAEGMEPLKLPLEMKKEDGKFLQEIDVFKKKTDGVHVTNEVDQWFQKYLNIPGCQLFCLPSDGTPRYVSKEKVPQEDYISHPLMFADGCPLLLSSENSVEYVNSKSENDVTSDRFRPNIIIGGCNAFDEDTWGMVQIGDSVMESLYPCQRCVAINVDPKKGIIDKSKKLLLNEMEKIRPTPDGEWPTLPPKIPIFGYNYGVKTPGTIKIGDPVYCIVK